MTIRLTATERQDNAIDVENDLGSVSTGLLGTCDTCQSAYGMEPREFYSAVHESQSLFDEGGFSWHECELCGSHLGGDRYAAHAIKQERPDGRWIVTHLDVCCDCVMATANGEPWPDEE